MKFPRWLCAIINKVGKADEKISDWTKNSPWGTKIKRWTKLLVIFQLGFLFMQKTIAESDTREAVTDKKKAQTEANEYKNANEILQSERFFRSGFKSRQVTWWKKAVIREKDTIRFVMVEVSPTYEKKFLIGLNIPTSSYIGFDDYMVWPKELADEFRSEDLQVYENKNTLYTTGHSPVSNDLLIIKEFLLENGREYVIGLAIDKELAKNWFKKKGAKTNKE